jgi:hypothetical protein
MSSCGHMSHVSQYVLLIPIMFQRPGSCPSGPTRNPALLVFELSPRKDRTCAPCTRGLVVLSADISWLREMLVFHQINSYSKIKVSYLRHRSEPKGPVRRNESKVRTNKGSKYVTPSPEPGSHWNSKLRRFPHTEVRGQLASCCRRGCNFRGNVAVPALWRGHAYGQTLTPSGNYMDHLL